MRLSILSDDGAISFARIIAASRGVRLQAVERRQPIMLTLLTINAI